MQGGREAGRRAGEQVGRQAGRHAQRDTNTHRWQQRPQDASAPVFVKGDSRHLPVLSHKDFSVLYEETSDGGESAGLISFMRRSIWGRCKRTHAHARTQTHTHTHTHTYTHLVPDAVRPAAPYAPPLGGDAAAEAAPAGHSELCEHHWLVARACARSIAFSVLCEELSDGGVSHRDPGP